MTNNKEDKSLFWGCFIALIATAFGFIVRAFIIGDWAKEFNLDATQQGELFGAGLWPFAISIILFSLIMDKIGYKTAMVFGFACHVTSVILTVTATGYNSLYLAMFVCALGNGTVEAYINPVVATLFSKEKARYLNYLHGGWSGGFVVGGIILIAMGTIGWRTKVLILLIPIIIYFIMLIAKKFPVGESAAAGVPLKETLGEVGGLGFFLISWMALSEALRSTHLVVATDADPLAPLKIGGYISAVIGLGLGFYLKSFFGRPMFILLLLLMIPLATTELGVDSWITDLMTPVMGKWAPWLLVYTAAIMTALRFCAGPILRAFSPLGLLAVCAVLAGLGLVALANAETAGMIFLAGTLYGIGKTFFWPTTLGVVSEQFPRGGAMTLNGISGTGMLGVGVLGAMFLGSIQDGTIDKNIMAENPALHAQVVTAEKVSLFGKYMAVDPAAVGKQTPADQAVVKRVQDGSKKSALSTVAWFPAIMFATYVALLLYFKAKGGYKPVDVNAPTAH